MLLTSDNRRKSFKILLTYVLPIIIMILLLYYAFMDVEFDKMLASIQDVSFFWLFIFIICFYLSHYLRALRWKEIISPIKKDTSTRNLFASTMIGYGVNCVVPRLGEVYRPSFLGKWEGISRSALFGTIVIERIIDLILLAVSVIISGFLYEGSLYNDIPFLKTALIIGTISTFIPIIIILLIIKYKEPFYKIIVNFVARFSIKFSQKLQHFFEMLTQGFSTIKSFKSFMIILAYSIAIMFIYGLNSLFAFYMLNVFDVNYSIAFIVMSISAFGIVVPTPNGTGSYHVLCILSITKLGYDKDFAAAYALFSHFITTIAFIVTTFLVTIYVNKKVELNNKANFWNVLKIKKLDE